MRTIVIALSIVFCFGAVDAYSSESLPPMMCTFDDGVDPCSEQGLARLPANYQEACCSGVDWKEQADFPREKGSSPAYVTDVTPAPTDSLILHPDFRIHFQGGGLNGEEGVTGMQYLMVRLVRKSDGFYKFPRFLGWNPGTEPNNEPLFVAWFFEDGIPPYTQYTLVIDNAGTNLDKTYYYDYTSIREREYSAIVHVTGNGSGVVVSDDHQIVCGDYCYGRFSNTQGEVKFTFYAGDGTVKPKSWSGKNCYHRTYPYMLMDENMECTVEFVCDSDECKDVEIDIERRIVPSLSTDGMILLFLFLVFICFRKQSRRKGFNK